ncbi:MAG: sodium:alanine symporter family protein [Candidatus Saganbacteria bacterium]|nr:sodium:alanine symporter family protein [Candidatus Saganbacteria bacterium]
MQGLENLLNVVCGWMWGPPLLILLCGTHLFLTFRLRFIQRYIWKAIKLSLPTKEDRGKGDISHFSSLMTALAATIGTGNIVGVSAAVALGGPGAVLWMWLTGVFGIATKYSEALLSIKYRITNEAGEMSGGPMYVLERGMKMKWLGIIFAAFTAIAAFGIGNVVQANSITNLLKDSFGISPWLSGAVITLLSAAVILGGIKSIAGVCRFLVPFMAIFYILGCIIILLMNIGTIPHALKLIVFTAFTGQAALGGFAGAGIKETIRFGVARGLFSNESGLGSAPIVAAAAKTRNPVEQALVSSTGTFWDTVVVCAMTGLVVVNSGQWMKGLNGPMLTKAAFDDIYIIGPIVLTIALLTFVFSTLIGWSYYGEKAMEYLFGIKSVMPYRWVWVFAIMLGSVATFPVVWAFADIANALMALPNLISLIVLSGVIVAETKTHLWDKEKKEKPSCLDALT